MALDGRIVTVMEGWRSSLFEPRELWWEAGGINHPAVTEFAGRKYMLYEAVGADHLHRFGLAISEDGEHFEQFDIPHLEGDEHSILDRLGITTPRLTKIDREFVLTYASLSVKQGVFNAKADVVPWRSRVGLMITRDFRRYDRRGVVIADLDTHDPVLFPGKIQGNYWLLHRLDKGIHASVATSLRAFGGGYQLLEPEAPWEAGGIAAACAPIEVDRGWLLFYNAIDSKGVFRGGAVLLDRQNPAFVIARTKQPLLEAVEPWEKRGHDERGVQVGSVLRSENELQIYYGAGAKVIGLAKLRVDAVLQSLGLPTT